MSHWRMLKKIDEFGENYDELLNKWKCNREHSCKKQAVLSIVLVVEDAENDVVPEGLQTVNVTDLGLSLATAPQQLLEDIDAYLSIDAIKERVKLRMGSHFDEKGSNFIADEIQKVNGGTFNSKTLKDIEQQVLLSHPPTYQSLATTLTSWSRLNTWALKLAGLKVVANKDTLLLMIVSMLRKPGNICCGHKMFLKEIRKFLCLRHKFCVRNKCCARMQTGNICVRNIVSSFTTALRILRPIVILISFLLKNFQQLL